MKNLLILLFFAPLVALAGNAGQHWQSQTLITNGNMGNATLSSQGAFINNFNDVSVTAIWTGNASGNFAIQVSDDQAAINQTSGADPAANVVNWLNYTGSTVAAGGVSGSHGWDVPLTGYRWIRLQFLESSGTGNLNALINMKGP